MKWNKEAVGTAMFNAGFGTVLGGIIIADQIDAPVFGAIGIGAAALMVVGNRLAQQKPLAFGKSNNNDLNR